MALADCNQCEVRHLRIPSEKESPGTSPYFFRRQNEKKSAGQKKDIPGF